MTALMASRDIKLVVPTSFEGIAEALVRLVAFLAHHGVGAKKNSDIELACAEALNNLVEHGRPSQKAFDIYLEAQINSSDVTVFIRDTGQSFALPTAADAKKSADNSLQAFRDGGFGWSLIHLLTDGVELSNDALGNSLKLKFLIGH